MPVSMEHIMTGNPDSTAYHDGPRPSDLDILKVQKTGKLTVVGFGGRDAPDEYCIAGARERLLDLIERHDCKELAFDFKGMSRVPSGMLGVMQSIAKGGVNVSAYNPSPGVREVFEVAKFDRFIRISDVE